MVPSGKDISRSATHGKPGRAFFFGDLTEINYYISHYYLICAFLLFFRNIAQPNATDPGRLSTFSAGTKKF
ncbi:hypothetical protein KL86DPRO_60230 [uncultured delta proteobacterium]|uniref:Uncharacterized protein n=1 Tax=uncultured delta proteobacterium TaxID=34034 RepID=A0A212KG53_9DELT|nr:hypothetical protein KL86DPRO_60230 [uncultured delta proteobacterium]